MKDMFRVWSTSAAKIFTAAALIAASISALAQGTIPWVAAAKQPAQLTSPTSPAAVEFNNQIYVYYCDQSTNYLYGASTPSPSTNLTILGSTGMLCGGGGASMALNATLLPNGPNNSGIPTLYLSGWNIPAGILSSTDGVNWTIGSLTLVNDTLASGYNFAIAAFQNQLYMAYYGTHGSSIASSSDGGHNFYYQGTISSLAPSNPSTAWTPGYSLRASDDGNTLYVAYTTGTAGYMTVGHSTDGVNWSTQQYTNSTFGHDPTIVQYAGAIWVLGQCVCNGHQIWATGAYDGVSFPQATEYGATMNNSLSAVEYNGGALYTVFRSNFANDLWSWYTN